MSGTMYTGKSADGSDMQEVGSGVFTNPDNPEEWSNMPYPLFAQTEIHVGNDYWINRSKEQKMAFEIYNHIEVNNRSLKDEYNLVKQKKSTLSRHLRDFVIELIEVYEEEQTGV